MKLVFLDPDRIVEISVLWIGTYISRKLSNLSKSLSWEVVELMSVALQNLYFFILQEIRKCNLVLMDVLREGNSDECNPGE